jgi:hypothetical protein
MGRGNQESGYPGQLQWVKLPTGEHRWSGGPIICRQRRAGWIVELSVHGELGRRSAQLAGPFEGLGEAKRAASALLLKARVRKLRRFSDEHPVAA